MSDIIKTPNGKISGGQFFEKPATPRGDGYQHAGCDMARRSDGKVLPTPQIAHGMKRQTQGALSPHIHGVVVQDEPNTGLKFTGKAPPNHPGMPSRAQRGTHKGEDGGSLVLRASGRLSLADAALSSNEGFDPSFIQHKVGHLALPPGKSRRDR